MKGSILKLDNSEIIIIDDSQYNVKYIVLSTGETKTIPIDILRDNAVDTKKTIKDVTIQSWIKDKILKFTKDN